jgi:hypothetical protein
MSMFDYDAQPVTPGVVLVGTPASRGAYAIRDFLSRNGYPFEWIDAGQSDAVRAALGIAEVEPSALPLCILPDGSRLASATVEQVAAGLGMVAAPSRPEYDLTIVGAGPAGLAAAVNAASEGLHTVVIEAVAPGGQAGTTSMIENYLGFPNGISGSELATRATVQARRFGAELLLAIARPSSHPATVSASSVSLMLAACQLGGSWGQCRQQGGRVVAAAVDGAVDEQGRRARHLARGQAAVHVAADPVRHRAAGPVPVEDRRVQAELDGVPEQVAVFECLLPVEQQLVQVPEPALQPGGLRRGRRGEGVRVDAGQRKMPEREPDGPAELAFDLLDRTERLPGVRALVIAVLDDQTAGGRAADMVGVLVQRRQDQLPVLRRRVDSHGAPPGACGQIGPARRFSSRPAGG